LSVISYHNYSITRTFYAESSGSLAGVNTSNYEPDYAHPCLRTLWTGGVEARTCRQGVNQSGWHTGNF